MEAVVDVTNQAQYFRFAQLGTSNKADSAIDDFKMVSFPTLPPIPSPTSSPTFLRASPRPTLKPTPRPSLIPMPHPTPDSTSRVQGGASAKVDIVGYYGNSGNAVSSIPTLDAIHPNYNIIILTFAAISDLGKWTLDIQGPYAGNLDQLAADVLVWKAQVDPWDRQRAVLISIGGQNGHWPSGVSEEILLSGLWTFMAQYNLDGLDVDLEGADVAAAAMLSDIITNLTSSNKLVTAAPEAAQNVLDAYALILPLMSWVHPQFYNNGPNAVTTPYLPPAELWPTPWTVMDWQEEVKR